VASSKCGLSAKCWHVTYSIDYVAVTLKGNHLVIAGNMGHTKAFLRRKALNKIASQKAAEKRSKKRHTAESQDQGAEAAAAQPAAAVAVASADTAGLQQVDDLLPSVSAHSEGQHIGEHPGTNAAHESEHDHPVIAEGVQQQQQQQQQQQLGAATSGEVLCADMCVAYRSSLSDSHTALL
jgi:hypothetical protein